VFKENLISAIPCPSQIPCVSPWDWTCTPAAIG
jgi:hypothetical protein